MADEKTNDQVSDLGGPKDPAETPGVTYKEPDHDTAKVVETNETVPHVNEDIVQEPGKEPSQAPFRGPTHIDAAGQIAPGPHRPNLPHEDEVDKDGAEQRRAAKAAGWPSPVVDLNRPIPFPPADEASPAGPEMVQPAFVPQPVAKDSKKK